MNKFIKPFATFINESESGYYPAGTENDPRAPWNQEDPRVTRDNDWIDSRNAKEHIKFDLVKTDHSEYAILKHKETGDLYVAYLAGDEIEEYMPKEMIDAGQDEDGEADYDYEPLDMDDEAIIAMASDLADKAGEGLAAWEEGNPLCKMDDELKAEIIDIFGDFERMNEAKIPKKAHINVERLYELYEKIKDLKAELKENEDEYKGFEAQLKPIFDSMKVLEDKIATSEEYIIKITRYGHERQDVQWKPVVDMALERLDDAAKAIIAECIDANKRVTQVKHSFEVDKSEEAINEASVLGKIKEAIVSVITRFKAKIAGKFARIDSENEKLSKLLAKVK